MRCLKKSNTSHCGIPGKFISLISTPLSFPLCRLFNNLFEAGLFPSLWKTSHVTAIFKNKGHKTDKANYRPISLLPTLSKVCESIIHKRLLDHCLEYSIISDRQAAYLKGDSTIHQLLYIVDKIKSQWTKGNITHGIFLDVKAAFDKVWHRGLLAKLDQIGISGTLHQLFASYLADRKQVVVVDGCKSSVRDIKAGVPQGSRLGPLLFIIYINDIIKDIESEILIFADDTSLLVSGKNPQETSNTLNRDLIKIAEWSNKWKVIFNAEKSKQIIFSRNNLQNSPPILLNNQQIDRVNTHKHLGILLTYNLDWSPQVQSVCLKANRKLSVLRRVKMLSRQTLDVLYKVTVRSVIDYGLPLYYNSLKITDKARLDRVQYTAGKIVTGALNLTSKQKLEEDLAWESIQSRAEFLGLSIFHKIAISDTRPLIRSCMPQRNFSDQTRSEGFIHFPYTKEYYYKSFFPTFTRGYNKIDKPIRNSNTIDFKIQLSLKIKPN